VLAGFDCIKAGTLVSCFTVVSWSPEFHPARNHLALCLP
jgi:hypothetical protein